MSDDPRTPTHSEVSAYWQWGGRIWQDPAAFDRFVAKVCAEAWDEGYKARQNDLGAADTTPNPYRKDTV